MQTEEIVKRYLQALVTELVDKPAELVVDCQMSGDDQVAVYTVRTADGEVGKIIGKQGKNVQAVRTLLEAVAAKYKLRTVLEIADTRQPKRKRENSDHLYRER